MKKKNWIRICALVLVLVILALGLMACGQSEEATLQGTYTASGYKTFRFVGDRYSHSIAGMTMHGGSFKIDGDTIVLTTSDGVEKAYPFTISESGETFQIDMGSGFETFTKQ
ncbi:MAG: hypothetical protein II797_01340 [Clostridia bacterium]|nr:hypothetical protein [Clostridia bacterium]